ncbi:MULTISPECIES: hypothetical protein [unclassified Methanoculleus]|uniref:hypothetical protein n=1 Tax=unclassified Methanoculleus TaxID=2619537 RepID=UPI0025FAF836|nr:MULTISPECIES: hypothetical protein [unclassified Methanoculleus]MCK9318808.1 hypothetical protein [Methanoculleus sp.]MDD2254710.1 hypothetical protein [Methanoculleus sp.]MDD2787470.1 hypothetical protein [Methanoculleus sp.]MDD3216752.1 hypothetical protein [Methanoculleus sp.]MDD4313394.1 hypothetical protein [Methanoculleus sp.]
MTPDRALTGVVLVGSCLIAGGILIGAEIFAVDLPFAPYVMVTLATLVVLGAAALVLSCLERDESPSRQ